MEICFFQQLLMVINLGNIPKILALGFCCYRQDASIDEVWCILHLLFSCVQYMGRKKKLSQYVACYIPCITYGVN
jgi:hypothetical protein